VKISTVVPDTFCIVTTLFSFESTPAISVHFSSWPVCAIKPIQPKFNLARTCYTCCATTCIGLRIRAQAKAGGNQSTMSYASFARTMRSRLTNSEALVCFAFGSNTHLYPESTLLDVKESATRGTENPSRVRRRSKQVAAKTIFP
jgi:hypothetical protein